MFSSSRVKRILSSRVLSIAMLAGVVLSPFDGTPVALAQVTTASVNGIVQDSTDANIPGARVELSNEAPNSARRSNDYCHRTKWSFGDPASVTITVTVTN